MHHTAFSKLAGTPCSSRHAPQIPFSPFSMPCIIPVSIRAPTFEYLFCAYHYELSQYYRLGATVTTRLPIRLSSKTFARRRHSAVQRHIACFCRAHDDFTARLGRLSADMRYFTTSSNNMQQTAPSSLAFHYMPQSRCDAAQPQTIISRYVRVI